MSLRSLFLQVLWVGFIYGGVMAAEYREVVNGYNANSVIMGLDPKVLGEGDEFGIQVDIWNGIAAVSAVGRAIDSSMEVQTSGSVYIFKTSDNYWWKYTGVSLRSGRYNDGFGTGLAVGDGVVVVGAPYDSRRVQNGGAAYVYLGVAPTFSSPMTLLPNGNIEKDGFFGTSVAIVKSERAFKNGALVIGAPGYPHDGHHNIGAVFVYSQNYGSTTYSFQMKLEPSEMKDGGKMGSSLASYGRTLVVGAPGANAVFLYELQLHVEDCPHDHPEDIPDDACQFRRVLQGGDEGQQDREQREREERERQEKEANRRVYYVWKYDEILDIHLENEKDHQNSQFGTSVSIYNDTVLTVVVGAPGATSATTSKGDAGAAYVLTMMNRNDIWPNFSPDGYDEHHPDDHHHIKWDPSQKTVGWDSLDNFWLRESVFYGESAGERFGYSVAADYNYVLVGSNSEYAFGYGVVKSYRRQATSSPDTDRPIVKGPLYKNAFISYGTLSDTKGNKGDKFGSSLALYKNHLLIGSYLKGIESSITVGTGAAYIYNNIKRVALPTPAPTPTPAVVTSSSNNNKDLHIDMSRAMKISVGASLLFILSVLGVYGVYKYRGGKKDASVVLGSSWESLKEISLKLPYFGDKDKQSQVSLSMDDSTSSQTPMNSNLDSSHGGKYGGNSAKQFNPVQQGPPSGPPQPQQSPRGPYRPQQSYPRPNYAQNQGNRLNMNQGNSPNLQSPYSQPRPRGVPTHSPQTPGQYPQYRSPGARGGNGL